MKEIMRLVLVLGGICTLAGLSLATVYDLTKETIRLTELKNVQGPAIESLLPASIRDNDPIQKSFALPAGNDNRGKPIEKMIFPATKGGQLQAVALEGSGKGYKGSTVKIMVGIDPQNGQILGIAVTDAAGETAGIGSRIKDPEFTGQFKDRSVESATAVDGISGASFSTKGAFGAVEDAVNFYQQNKDKILAEAGK